MGTGRGHPDRLTGKGMRVLRAAEVVLHDGQVGPRILDLIPASTQVRNVGEPSGKAGLPREKFHSLLISAAREGRQVVRLKADYPLPSAQGAEEMSALSQSGVAFAVI